MSRRKKKVEHVSHDRWLVSYADFITLLFAFFVVLYSSSQVDKRRVGRLAMAIQVAFQELGVFDTSNTKVPLGDSEAMPFSKVQAVENVERITDMERVVQPMKGILSPAPPPAPLKEVQTELEKALAPEIQKHVVDIKARKEGLIVSLREMGFYESGSATMRTSSLGAVDRLAYVLVPRTESIRIEGHTDNVPIHNLHFASTGSFLRRVPPNSCASSSIAIMSIRHAFPRPAMRNSTPLPTTTPPMGARATGALTLSFSTRRLEKDYLSSPPGRSSAPR